MKNTKKLVSREVFAKVVLECSVSMFQQVLNGKKNFSFKKARKAAETLGTEITLWMDPNALVSKDRKAAWNKFSREGRA